MNTRFQNKVALVTGGTSGIGRAAAIAFAREGARVALTGRREAEGLAVVRAIEKAGGQARFIQADFSREDQIIRAVKETVEAFGRLDCAFNNAGTEGSFAPITEVNQGAYQKVFDINVKGVLFSMKHEIPAMLKNGGGAIVNTASIAAHIGMPGGSIYMASKHAVVGLTKVAALEWSKAGIRVNAVSPGAIETEMFSRFEKAAPHIRETIVSSHPIGRTGQADEIANPVLFLCSAEASFITGHALAVDGGYLAQ